MTNVQNNPVTRRDIMELMDRQHDLTAHGFGAFTGSDFAEERLALLDSERAVNTCLDWLKLQKKTKNIRTVHWSYHLKHVVEDWYRETNNQELSIPNGALIAAAYLLGFKVKRIPKTPNAYFNIRLVD